MAWNIYPTETPVGSFVGDLSNRIREFQLARKDFLQGYSRSFVSWQYDLSIGSGLAVNVAAGEAFINGFYVYSDAVVNVSGLSPSTTNYVYLQLVKTGSLVTSAQILANTTGTLPSDSVMLGRAITHTDHVDSVGNSIKVPGSVYQGTFTGDGTASQFVFVGLAPKLVSILSDTPASVIWINSRDTSTPRLDTLGFYVDSNGIYTTVYYLAWC